MTRAWPLLGGLVLWAIGWMLMPTLDPVDERGDWGRGSEFVRPWCPMCKGVENVSESALLSGLTAVVQLGLLTMVVAAAVHLVTNRFSH